MTKEAEALLVFNLAGTLEFSSCQGAALTSSSNCAIEICYLAQQIFSGKLPTIKNVIVLTDEDVDQPALIEETLLVRMSASALGLEALKNLTKAMPPQIERDVSSTVTTWLAHYNQAANSDGIAKPGWFVGPGIN